MVFLRIDVKDLFQRGILGAILRSGRLFSSARHRPPHAVEEDMVLELPGTPLKRGT
jgi:hypothetical protein